MTLPDTITRTLATDSRFSLMAQALRAAGLDTVLAGKGPFTVCVPTDEAFRVLPPEPLPRSWPILRAAAPGPPVPYPLWQPLVQHDKETELPQDPSRHHRRDNRKRRCRDLRRRCRNHPGYFLHKRDDPWHRPGGYSPVRPGSRTGRDTGRVPDAPWTPRGSPGQVYSPDRKNRRFPITSRTTTYNLFHEQYFIR